jgi:phosphohistidine phosphatase
MNVFILRHAEAAQQGASDADRPLTDKGVKQAKTVGRFCAEHDIKPYLIISSPLLRARDTAQIVAGSLKGKVEIKIDDSLRPGMDTERGLALLEKQSVNAVMLVGHEPDLSAFCAALLGAKNEAIHLRKAGLVEIDLTEFKPAGGTLEFLLPVKFL